ncbi:MAG: hypothetical protein RIR12_294 [Bacteroidota bacterium]|jgi:hypothetical protein
MIDIKKIKKIDEIINAEGTILGLYNNGNEFILGSYLNNNLGTVYYSVDFAMLKKYVTSQVTLRQLYLDSKDTIVIVKNRTNTDSFIKEDLADSLELGDNLFSEISSGIRNDNFFQKYFGD